VKFGNYINLPYYGPTRPIIFPCENEAPGHSQCDFEFCEGGWCRFDDVGQWISEATESKNDPEEWRKRARWLKLEEPQVRVSDVEFGTRPNLHICADYIIEGARSGERPITEGQRAAIYYMLSKNLRNWEAMSDDEALEILMEINATSPDPFPPSEIKRMFRNAEGRTSTGCDDPLIQPYAHPDCPIANPRS
jgi:hypothetical protein